MPAVYVHQSRANRCWSDRPKSSLNPQSKTHNEHRPRMPLPKEHPIQPNVPCETRQKAISSQYTASSALRVYARPDFSQCLVIHFSVIRCCRCKSRNSFPTTIWYLQSRFQVPCRVHQSPLVLPILSWSVVNNLPRLVKRLEPIIQTR